MQTKFDCIINNLPSPRKCFADIIFEGIAHVGGGDTFSITVLQSLCRGWSGSFRCCWLELAFVAAHATLDIFLSFFVFQFNLFSRWVHCRQYYPRRSHFAQRYRCSSAPFSIQFQFVFARSGKRTPQIYVYKSKRERTNYRWKQFNKFHFNRPIHRVGDCWSFRISSNYREIPIYLFMIIYSVCKHFNVLWSPVHAYRVYRRAWTGCDS